MLAQESKDHCQGVLYDLTIERLPGADTLNTFSALDCLSFEVNHHVHKVTGDNQIRQPFCSFITFFWAALHA